MIQELLNQSEPAGNASWTSGKMLVIIAIVASSGMMFSVGIAVLAPEVVKTLGMVAFGLGGVLIGFMATILVVWNFNKMLKETGFR